MDWQLAEKFGERFLKELKVALGGDYSRFNKDSFLKTHKTMMETGEWFFLQL